MKARRSRPLIGIRGKRKIQRLLCSGPRDQDTCFRAISRTPLGMQKATKLYRLRWEEERRRHAKEHVLAGRTRRRLPVRTPGNRAGQGRERGTKENVLIGPIYHRWLEQKFCGQKTGCNFQRRSRWDESDGVQESVAASSRARWLVCTFISSWVRPKCGAMRRWKKRNGRCTHS